VLTKKECNFFIGEFKKTFKNFENKHKKLGNRGQVIQNYFLYNKIYLKLLELKKVDNILKKVIDENYVLINSSLTNRFKRYNKFDKKSLHLEDLGGEWHHDSRLIGNRRLDRGFSFIVTIMLDKFEEDNGCTLYVEKSHLIRDKSPERKKNYKHKKILGEQGTVAIIDTGLWHKAGEPSDKKTRWSIFSYYGPWFMKPYYNYPAMIKKIYNNSINKNLKKILHCNSIPPENELESIYTLRS
jgi:hypothetical protein